MRSGAMLSDRFDDARLAGVVLAALPDAVLVVDDTGVVLSVNAAGERLFGYERHELVGSPVEVLMPERFRRRHERQRRGYAAKGGQRLSAIGLHLVGLHKDGRELPVEVLLTPLAGSSFTLATVRDISERARIESDLAHFAAIVEGSNDAIFAVAADGTVVSWNAAAERLYGYGAEEVVGKRVLSLAGPGQDDALASAIERAMAGEATVGREAVQVRKDGVLLDVSFTVSTVRDRQGKVAGASVVARDISELVRYREQLRYIADHDPLTGAQCRRSFERDLSEQVGRAKRYGERAAVLVIDVDDFKSVNDRFGHPAGDAVLRSVADALRQRLRKTDTVARLGGDEFGALIPYAGADEAAIVAADLRQAVAAISAGQGPLAKVRLSISIGVALIDGSTSPSDVFLAADRAMYEDKPRHRRTALPVVR